MYIMTGIALTYCKHWIVKTDLAKIFKFLHTYKGLRCGRLVNARDAYLKGCVSKTRTQRQN